MEWGGGGSTLCRGEHSQFGLIALALAKDLLLFKKEYLSFLSPMQAVVRAERRGREKPGGTGQVFTLRCVAPSDFFWGGGPGEGEKITWTPEERSDV